MKIKTYTSRDFYSMGFIFKNDEASNAFAQIIRSELKVRICKVLLGSVPSERLKEFMVSNDESEEEMWLERNYPGYRGILIEKHAELKHEIEKHRSRIPGAILTLDALDLSIRSYNGLKRAGLDTVDKIAAFNEIDDLSKIRGLRWRDVEEIKEKLDFAIKLRKLKGQFRSISYEFFLTTLK